MDNVTLVVNIAFSIRMIIPVIDGVKYQAANSKLLTSHLKLLKQLFEDLLQCKYPLSETTISAFGSLYSALQEAKTELRKYCKESKIYSVLRSHQMCAQLQKVNSELQRALSNARLKSPRVSKQIQHLAEKCVHELGKTKYTVDALDDHIRVEVENFLVEHRHGKKPSFERLHRMASYMDINTKNDICSELAALEKARGEARAENSKSEEDFIDQVISLFMQLAEEDDFEIDNHEDGEVKVDHDIQEVVIPPDFRCPLSLELMYDPVIVSSGQTYERAYIQHWLDQGHTRCPKTGQALAHTNLIPNYTVKDLIANWCKTHDVPLPKVDGVKSMKWLSSSLLASDLVVQEEISDNSDERRQLQEDDNTLETSEPCEPTMVTPPELPGNAEAAVPRSSSFQDAAAAMIDLLVKELQSHNVEKQRSAAGELRLLARKGEQDRLKIAEAGAVMYLVALLSSSDEETQEYAVTALLNLSIDNINKAEIADSGAINPLILVLNVGNMEARQNAAATLFSLVGKNEDIARRIVSSGAIPPLIDLLKDGMPLGKKDAATALYNLCLCPDNKLKIVEAGAVMPLIELIREPRIGMVDRAVQVLDRLSTINEGKVAIGEGGAIPFLVDVLEAGTPRGKEQAAAILLQLCGDSRRFRNMSIQAGAIPSLHNLSHTGNARAKEKAVGLLRLFREQRQHHSRHHHHSTSGRM